MTRNEASNFVKGLAHTYSGPFSGMDSDTLRWQVDMWASTCAEFTYQQVLAGFQAFLRTDTKGFPPVPGQVIALIHQVHDVPAEDGLSAWAKVRTAVANSNYKSGQEFAKLPELAQIAVGSPENLRAWAAIDQQEFETVVQSQFLNNYRAAVKRRAEDRKITDAVRQAIGQEAAPEIPKAERPAYKPIGMLAQGESIPAPTDLISRIIAFRAKKEEEA